ncbi:hypothetical protein FRC11_004789 [Ceratobasidium sp. 423]|nr:hypothetical protein FRC11_004789 [Ceratobasidium sp. 423]
MFPDELDKLNKIEGVYDSLKPDGTIKYLFKTALQLASIAAEVRAQYAMSFRKSLLSPPQALPEGTAKLSFMVVVKAWELLEQQTRLDDDIQDILRGLLRIQDVIEVLSQASSSMIATAMDQSKESMNNILVLLENVSVHIFNRLATNDSEDISHDEAHSSDPYDIEAYLAGLESFQKAFHASWSPSIAPGPPMDPSPTNVVDDEPPVSALACQNIQVTVDESAPRPADPYEMLNLLRPMDPSGYDPGCACLEGTREAVLNRIVTWTRNRENTESFMWISGQAGMGKTSIATSLCKELDKTRALAGSLFCQRDDPNSSDPLRFINNLVHTIALRFPAYAYEVAHAIRTDRSLCTSHLSLRYEGLVKRPLMRLKCLSMPTTLVVVVDGLDECGDCDSRERILHKLYDMSKLVPWLKVIFTARPEGDLVEYFRSDCPNQPIVHLQTYDAADDIRAYIENRLGNLARKGRWPDGSIGQLCSMAEGVFLWAALATRYIKQSSIPALSRLRKVLENRKSPVTDHFDALYTRALQLAMKDDEDDTKVAYIRCIGAILTISELNYPTISDMQHILVAAGRIEPGTLEQIVSNLGPLVLVTDGQYVRFHHTSFKNYATHTSRSQGSPIQLDHYEADLASCCLQIMREGLRFNICRLQTSHLLNNDVPDLKIRTQTCIGPALRYACTHWIDHFTASPSQALVDEIKTFLEGPQLMYWVEVLSLLGHMNIAILGLSKLASLELIQFDDWNLIVSWAKDARRFIQSFYDPIAASTPHLYISALAFAPTKSLTAQRMRPYFPNTVTIPHGGDLNWHPCVQTTLHPRAVQSLSTSPDGMKIVVGYPDGSLCILDKETGASYNKPLLGHTDSVTCAVFSPTGNRVASSSHDNTIRVWDIARDSKITSRALVGHSDSVHSVAFSPDATILASGSSDKTIRLWDPRSMRPIGGPYVGHSSRVSCVVFSPDGTRLVSGSWDKTIRVWSIEPDSRQLAGSPLVLTGHSDSVTCVAFSPDGSTIVSGSVDRTIQIWNVQGESDIKPGPSSTKHSDSITSVAFSFDGKLIASGSTDGVIQLWDSTTLIAYSRPFGHSDRVNGVAFSPDGAHIVSGSTDMTSRVWDIETSAKPISVKVTPGPFVGHSSTIWCVAVSSDGTRIASASSDTTVRMWDAETGTQIGSPFAGHSSGVYCVSISPDGTRIVSGSNDRTMKIWDTATQATVGSYQHKSNVFCAMFSPDGTLIAFGSNDGQVYLWDPKAWNMIGTTPQGHSSMVFSLTFSPDGDRIASASGGGKVILWDVKTHSRSGQPLSGHTAIVRSVAFSPCGTMLVSGSGDTTVRIWDIVTGRTIHELSGHSSAVWTVRYSPDGLHIASGSADNTIRLWDAKTGQIIGQPLTGHASCVKSIAFWPDGKRFVSSSDDATIRVWSLDISDPIEERTNDPPLPGTFSWPANPSGLSIHPHQPGWVTHDQQSLAFWLPLHYQQPTRFLGARTTAPKQISLDYSKFVHGASWTAVASDSIRQNPSNLV